jgi:hypothetical protein
MRISCPFCQSLAHLSPNPEMNEDAGIPRYVLECSQCSATNVLPPIVDGRSRRCSADGTFIPDGAVMTVHPTHVAS